MDNEGAFREIQRSLGRLEGKVDGMHEELHSQASTAMATLERVDRLESEHDKLKGGWAALSALAAVIAAGVSAAISWALG
jgi:hypothetical protein